MRNKGIMALSILLLLFSITACRPTYLIPVPVPEDPDSWEITAQVVASKLDLQQLNTDIIQDLKDSSISGLDAKWRTANPSAATQYSASIASRASSSARSGNIQDEVYIIVTFTDYKQDNGNVHITDGELILTAKGTVGTSNLELSSYSAATTKPLEISTTVNNQTARNSVQITIPTGEIKATISITDNEITVNGDITISVPPAYSGAAIIVDSTEVPVDSISDDADITAGFNGLFADGYGTRENPYEISNATQFMNIADEQVQKMFRHGENDSIYFELTGDIDLRNTKKTVIANLFSGNLNGNNHRIYVNNQMNYLFNYLFEDTTLSDFSIILGDTNPTRIFYSPAFLASGSFNGYDRGYTNSPSSATAYIYDKPTLTITMDNVDFIGPEDRFCYLGDANAALYASDNCSVAAALYNNNLDPDTFMSCVYTADTTNPSDEEYWTVYQINLSNCDVSGNFTGGYSDSGAAIFIGGQLYGTQVTITDCSFNGLLEGWNTAVAIANSNGCTIDKTSSAVTISGLSGGTVTSFSGKGSAEYSNAKNSTVLPSGGDISCTFTVNNSYALDSPEKNNDEKIEFADPASTAASYYQVKLSLPTLYWYLDETSSSFIAKTNSNTITLNFSTSDELQAASIYKAKVLTLLEAEHIADNGNGFGSLSSAEWVTSDEGYPVAFIEDNGTQYLIIDYSSRLGYAFMYSDSGLKTDTSSYKELSKVILIAKDANGKTIATSDFVSV